MSPLLSSLAPPSILQRTGTTASVSTILMEPDPEEGVLLFQPLTLPINPQRVKLARQAQVQGAKTVMATDFANAVVAAGKLTITLSDVMLVGDPFVMQTLNLLFALVQPWPTSPKSTFDPSQSAQSPGATVTPEAESGSTGSLGSAQGVLANITGTAANGLPAVSQGLGSASTTGSSITQVPATAQQSAAGKATYVLPMVRITWGSGLTYSVNVVQVTADITKVSVTGLPIEAKVELSLGNFPYVPEGTNPTSGGPAGRRRHTVVAGDNLVRIAATRYGDPRAWRAIAVANGMDDALRLPAGRTLFLPGGAEVAALQAGRRLQRVVLP
jgi:nucleoid-associated protein YgaU